MLMPSYSYDLTTKPLACSVVMRLYTVSASKDWQIKVPSICDNACVTPAVEVTVEIRLINIEVVVKVVVVGGSRIYGWWWTRWWWTRWWYICW